MPPEENTENTAETNGTTALTAEELLHKLGSDRTRGLSAAEARARLSEGANEVPEKRDRPLAKFLGKFWGLSAWMIELIAILSLILHKYPDLIVALGLLLVNAILSFLQERRATTAVDSLRRRLQVTSRVLRDGVWQTLPPRELVSGDIIRLRTGDFVPADAQILDGELRIDQSALTGESQELRKTIDDLIFTGSVMRRGEATALVVATGVKTKFGRTTELVASARPKLHVEAVVSRVVKWLFLIVGVQVALAVALSLANGTSLIEILPLALVLLMSAIPVALPVMFTVSMAVGSVELARKGVLITRLNAAEDAANMDVLCADKTGTLTLNRLTLVSTLPRPGFTQDDVVRAGALASNEADQDAIDLAFLRAAHDRRLILPADKQITFVPFSASSRHTEAVIETGEKRERVMKGALRTVAEAAGRTDSEITELESMAYSQAQTGVRSLAVARADIEGPWHLVGLALLSDPPRCDSRQLIAELRSLGVTVKMLTGDSLPVARAVASDLGLGEVVSVHELPATFDMTNKSCASGTFKADGFAEVFPEDKFLVVKRLQEAGHVVGMTGDGVNDAPALRQAEVGIAVSGSTDVAKGAASVVLTDEGLAGIVDLVKNGRAIYQRVLTWVVNKVSRTVFKSGFVVLAFFVTGKFVISAMGMVLLVFMTDFVKIALSTDRVRPSHKPETWNIGPLTRMAAVLGLMMLAESLVLLALGWKLFDLGQNVGQLQTFSFLTLLYFALFSIISVRERRNFWASRPSRTLSLALIGDACAGWLIGRHGLGELQPISTRQILLIMAWSLVNSLVVNDFVKLYLIKRFTIVEKTNNEVTLN